MARHRMQQVLLLAALVSLGGAEPFSLRRLDSGSGNDTTGCADSNDTNSTNSTNCNSSTNASALGQDDATTTATTTTTTTATTTTTRAADNSTTLVIIIVACSLVALVAGALCVFGLLQLLQSCVCENRKLAKQLDSDAADFEAHLGGVAGHVQRFNHRLEQDKALKENFEKECADFAKQWLKVEEDSREFLVKQYTPCLRQRQEVQHLKEKKRREADIKRRRAADRKAKAALDKEIRARRKVLDQEEKKRQKEGQPARTAEELDALAKETARQGQEESGRASLMIGGSSANLVPEEEVGLCPSLPVTGNRELRRQTKRFKELQDHHVVIIAQLKQLRDQVWPAGGSGLEDLDLPKPTETPKAPGGWWGAGTGAGKTFLEDQVAVMKTFGHPILRQMQVCPYGVLGTADGQKELAPFTPVEAVVVDPAGYNYIGYRNSCRGAGGASGSIYKWLNLPAPPASGRFPPEVNRHFSASREAEAEGRAKFFAYSQGQMVIHAVGPKLRELLPGLQCLSRTYLSILTEYCQALLAEDAQKAEQSKQDPVKAQAKGSKSKKNLQIPRILRLCPVSSGIFCEDARLQPYMADMTWSAISLALAMLPADLQDLLRTLQLEVCVFQTREFAMYQAALEARKALVSRPPTFDADRGRVSSRGGGPGGYDWVRKQNAPQDRLERLSAFMKTAQATAAGGYVLGTEQSLMIKDMLDGTRLHRATSPEKPSQGAPAAAAAEPSDNQASNADLPAASREAGSTPSTVPRVVYDQDGLTVIEAAVKVQKAGRAAVGVNAASAYSVGGGVLSGGRHALEESCCITSTLLASLQKAQWDQLHSPEEQPEKPGDRGDRGGRWREDEAPHAHVPVDGCIVSPAVQVFREGSSNGYGFYESPVRLQGFCSVAMFNMNPRVSDSPLDAPKDFKAYCLQVKAKFRAVVTAAAQMGAEVLVCPDVGCGVFGNDPQVLGAMLGEVLREPLPQGAIAEVLLTGQVAFAEAVRKAAAGEQVELKPPAYFASTYGAVDGYAPYGGGRQGSRGRPVRVAPHERTGPTVVVATVAQPSAAGSRGPVTASEPGAAAAQPVQSWMAQPTAAGAAPASSASATALAQPGTTVVPAVGAGGPAPASGVSPASGAAPQNPGEVPASGPGTVM